MINIAIIPGSACTLAEASSVAAAIQQHVTFNLQRTWHLSAVVTALESLEAGYVPLFVHDGPVAADLTGYHTVEADGSYYAIVEYGPTWSLAASHECLEMIVDPTGDRRQAGFSPTDSPTHVSFVVEVCDPCQDIANATTIGTWPMSDFVLPNYFSDHRVENASYSYSGHVKSPKQVLPGGSLSWIDGDNVAWQLLNDSGSATVVSRGPYQPGPMAAREYMHQFEQNYPLLSKGPGSNAYLRRGRTKKRAYELASLKSLNRFLDDVSTRSGTTKQRATTLQPRARRSAIPHSGNKSKPRSGEKR